MGWDCRIGASVDLGGDDPFWVNVLDEGHTFNCGPMFTACGATPPREWDGYEARMLIPTLEKNLALFRDNRGDLEKLNPGNGWGSYETVVQWQEGILAACRKAPKATVSVS